MAAPLPVYSAETLARLTAPELLALLRRDEDRVPRNVIDECAQRGDEMVCALEQLTGEDRFWRDEPPLEEWWLRLHAVMILGFVASEKAGSLLVSFMRRMEHAEDENLQDWLSGYWPALFRNKAQAIVPALRELAQDRGVDWYLRIQAVETVLAFGERRGAEALEAAIDRAAALAADQSEDPMLRWSAGGKLLDFPRERHRALLERLAAEQSGDFRHFDGDDVNKAYAAGRDEPHWQRFDDPWKFYTVQSIAARQERWKKEDDFPTDDAPEPCMRDAPKIGRNDPCPCGSGKKYKRCCLNKVKAEPPESLVWRRLRRLLDENRRDMVRFVVSTYGEAAIQEAWQRFVGDDAASVDPDTLHLQLFMPWFYHRWSPQAGKTRVRDSSLMGAVPTAEYLRRKPRLDPLLREYLHSCLASPFSAFEIVHADPGEGMRMKDLFTGEEHDVTERSASAAMRQADVVFGQLAQAGGLTLLEAAPGFAIPPIRKIDVLEFRRRRFGSVSKVAPERVRALEDALIALYRDIAEQLFAPKLPAMQNTDGEALSPRRVVFDVPSAQEAFDALKHLALADSEAELLRDAQRDAAGGLAQVRFSWLKQGNAQMKAWENTVLGAIELDGTRLVAEVNSEERERRLRQLIDHALGSRARYRATDVQALERLLAEAPVRGTERSESAKLSELPEVRAKLAEMMSGFYEQWVNERIPALGGRTPLEAVRDREGREAVAALVAQIERDGPRMKPPLDPAIPRRLRERLGLSGA